jgi:hypothetical protein
MKKLRKVPIDDEIGTKQKFNSEDDRLENLFDPVFFLHRTYNPYDILDSLKEKLAKSTP